MENIVEVLKYNKNKLIWKVYFYFLILKRGFESLKKNIINKNFYKKTTIFLNLSGFERYIHVYFLEELNEISHFVETLLPTKTSSLLFK